MVRAKPSSKPSLSTAWDPSTLFPAVCNHTHTLNLRPVPVSFSVAPLYLASHKLDKGGWVGLIKTQCVPFKCRQLILCVVNRQPGGGSCPTLLRTTARLERGPGLGNTQWLYSPISPATGFILALSQGRQGGPVRWSPNKRAGGTLLRLGWPWVQLLLHGQVCRAHPSTSTHSVCGK